MNMLQQKETFRLPLVTIPEISTFQTYNYASIYKKMQHPAAIFDGRLILDKKALRKIGYRVHAIGKQFNFCCIRYSLGSAPAEAYNLFGNSLI